MKGGEEKSSKKSMNKMREIVIEKLILNISFVNQEINEQKLLKF